MPRDDNRTPDAASGGDYDRWVLRKNRIKAIRVLWQAILVCLLIWLLWTLVLFPKQYRQERGTGTGDGFIAVAYNGVTARDSVDSSIVTRRAFEEQMKALYDNGYVTISQQDILDYYERGKPLPEKAMFLIFEDGILNTSTLVQPTLARYNYRATFCSYASDMLEANSRYAGAADLRRLSGNSYWELGTNGYRLSYINAFDRSGDYFGQLNADEFSHVRAYLRRDYNHYLMDFNRDADRLRLETQEEMEARLEYDYTGMRQVYEEELGFLPQMYILMHANTGAFGNDPLVSEKNREQLTDLFAMNFNRQGSCLNKRDSSVYDLTRLQVQPYFSVNHLLMRIQDDTGEPAAFVTGDQKAASHWYPDSGAAEYRDDRIILTTQPYGEGRVTLDSALISDVDLTVTLEGNKAGHQCVYLRTDRELDSGVQVALEYNELVIRDLSDGNRELLRLNLGNFDENSQKSKQEDQYEALEAYYRAVIQWDTDTRRAEQAKQELKALQKTKPLSVEQGAEPYVPELDISERGSHCLHVRLIGTQLTVWLDGRLAAQNLAVSADRRGNVALGAGVWKADTYYSQRNIWDDVYDAVFTELTIRDGSGGTVLYTNRLNALQKAQKAVRSAWSSTRSFFMEHL